jgi:general secretion pathway protein H
MMPVRSSTKKCDDGLTLVEMMVVLAILAISAAVAYPSFRASSETNEPALHLTRISAMLKAARGRSISSGRDVAFVINTTDSTYGLSSDTTPTQFPKVLSMTLTAARSTAPGEEGAALVFFPDGSSTGGRISITDGRKTAGLVVGWLTGAVSRTEPLP